MSQSAKDLAGGGMADPAMPRLSIEAIDLLDDAALAWADAARDSEARLAATALAQLVAWQRDARHPSQPPKES